MTLQRIAIIGSPGAGKATLARELSRRLNLPLYHLDRMFWQPNWVATPREAFVAEQERLTRADRRIFDGNYNGSLPIRLAAADTIIFLDLPISLCLGSVLRRSFQNTQRPDMGDGCPEKPFRWEYFEFLRFVLSFPRHSRPRILGLLRTRGAGKRIYQMRSRASVSSFLRQPNSAS